MTTHACVCGYEHDEIPKPPPEPKRAYYGLMRAGSGDYWLTTGSMDTEEERRRTLVDLNLASRIVGVVHLSREEYHTIEKELHKIR